MQYSVLSIMFQTFVPENNRAKVYPEENSQMTEDILSPMERGKSHCSHTQNNELGDKLHSQFCLSLGV